MIEMYSPHGVTSSTDLSVPSGNEIRTGASSRPCFRCFTKPRNCSGTRGDESGSGQALVAD
jgi:hypothetical protein